MFRILLPLLLWCAAPSVHALGIDDLVQKNIDARGGLAALRAMNSLKTSGRLGFSQGDFSIDLGYTSYARRDTRLRTELSMQGLSQVTGYASGDAWMINPFQGRRDPERISAEDAKDYEIPADLDGPLEVGLDRRAAYSVTDRKAQFDAVMRVHALFGRMTDLTDRILALGAAAGTSAEGLAADDSLRENLEALASETAELRKRIVATKEGGAITGEERLREFTDQLYGALLGYEGRPAQTLTERTGVLESELAEVDASLETLADKRLPALNEGLRARKREELVLPAPGEPVAQTSIDVVGGGTSEPARFARHPLWHVRLR